MAMNSIRANYLAYTYPVRRDIVSMARDERGHWVLQLACGHTGSCVGHMVPMQHEGWNCSECSKENVCTNPRWANEWSSGADTSPDNSGIQKDKIRN